MQNPNHQSALSDPWVRVLVIIITFIAALHLGQTIWHLVGQVSDLLVLFVLAWLISFVLEPLVVALAQIRWVSRPAAVVVIYTGALVALGVTGVTLVPELAAQSARAADQLALMPDRFSVWWTAGPGAVLKARGIPVETYVDQALRSVQSVGPTLVTNVVSVATGAASTLVQVLLVFIVSLYFMLDAERIGSAVVAAVPTRYRDDFTYFVSSVYKAFGGFLRGQIIQATVYGAGVAAILLFTGLPFVALGGVAAGAFMFIPFVGPPLGMVPPLLAVVSTDLGRFWFVCVPTLALNTLVVNVVAPKVMSQSIGLHPVMVLAAVLIGARVAGPWGALFGVPVAAVIAAMASFYQLTVAERQERIQTVTRPPDDADPNALEHPIEPAGFGGGVNRR